MKGMLSVGVTVNARNVEHWFDGECKEFCALV
jgi:hypothetical protein